MTPAALARVHADAWEVDGRLRERDGGGVRAVRGMRLMASRLLASTGASGSATRPLEVDVNL